MDYAIEYRVPDPYDIGAHDLSSYLLVNSVGYYDIEETIGPIRKVHRKNGRLDFLLCYVHKGRMRVYYDNREHILNTGIFLYSPHKENYYWQDTREPFNIFWIHFTGYGAKELLEAANLGHGGVYNTGVLSDLPQTFEYIIKEISMKKPGYELISASMLMLLISILGRKASIQESDGQNIFDPRIQNVMDYIRKHYQEQISVGYLAEMTELSASHFARLFKQHSGVYPLQYIINYRLQKACELMHHTNLSIKQISSSIGFDDQLYFSRLFKKHKGITPIDYLKHMKNNTFFMSIPDRK